MFGQTSLTEKMTEKNPRQYTAQARLPQVTTSARKLPGGKYMYLYLALTKHLPLTGVQLLLTCFRNKTDHGRNFAIKRELKHFNSFTDKLSKVGINIQLVQSSKQFKKRFYYKSNSNRFIFYNSLIIYAGDMIYRLKIRVFLAACSTNTMYMCKLHVKQ